jgi:hypothetical protein
MILNIQPLLTKSLEGAQTLAIMCGYISLGGLYCYLSGPAAHFFII